jgi:UDP-glucose 4-epimerase
LPTTTLVTGGAGFIGSNLVDALVARGDRVVVIDTLVSGKRSNLEGALASNRCELVEVDVSDAEAVLAVFSRVRPEIVFHMAAQIDVRRSVEAPAFDAHVNVIGAVSVLQAALACGTRRLVNTSTGGGLYGDASVLPTPESHPTRPLAPYGQSKLAAESYFELFCRMHGLSTVSLRYGNVYGPRQDVHGEAGVVAIFCGCLIDGRSPTVFGDGLQTRDWVEVSDVVRANLLAADCSVTGPFNVGRGIETSVLGFLDLLSEVGARLGITRRQPVFAPARTGEVRRSCLDAALARTQLGWRSTVALEDGLVKVIMHHDTYMTDILRLTMTVPAHGRVAGLIQGRSGE